MKFINEMCEIGKMRHVLLNSKKVLIKAAQSIILSDKMAFYGCLLGF